MSEETTKLLKTIRRALLAVAGPETAYSPAEYNPQVSPLDQHCKAVAWVVQKACGGCIVTGRVQGETHYWNRLPCGDEVDLSSCQYGGDGFTPLRKGTKVKNTANSNPRFIKFWEKACRKIGKPLQDCPI